MTGSEIKPSINLEIFWQAHLASLPARERPGLVRYESWYFGDTAEAARACAGLVRAGIKTATSGLVWEMEAAGERMPAPGDRAIVTDINDKPYCIIAVTECVIRPFMDVDERFAFDYGEGDRTLAGWRRDAWDYFAPICERLGREPGETMPLACQRFHLLYPQPLETPDMRNKP